MVERLAGLAHYPKPVEETIAQALAAAARAATILAKPELDLEPLRARVDPARCDGCALCLDVCPYAALRPGVLADGRKTVLLEAARCKGCGACQAACPLEAVEVAGFTQAQLLAQVAAALDDLKDADHGG
jgi:heterodisulfide reductase subunit A